MGRNRITFPLKWIGYEGKSEDMENLELKGKEVNRAQFSYRLIGIGMVGLSYGNRNWAQHLPTLEISVVGGTDSLAPLPLGS